MTERKTDSDREKDRQTVTERKTDSDREKDRQ